MSLRDDLLAEQCLDAIVEIRGKRFLIIEMDRTTKFELIYQARQGNTDRKFADMLEKLYLCECVRDPESRERVIDAIDIDQWNKVPSSITSALVSKVLQLNPMDAEDKSEKKE